MTTVNGSVRDRLADVRQRIKDARALIDVDKRQRDRGDPKAQASLDHYTGQLENLRAQERDILREMAAGGNHSTTGFLADNEVVDTLRGIAHTTAPIGRVHLGELYDVQQTVELTGHAIQAAVTTTDRQQAGRARVIVPDLVTPTTLLDLIPTAPMDGKSVPYVVESGTDAAAPTAHGAVKPESGLVYEDAEAIARTIAHFFKLPKQTLADTPRLAERLDVRDRGGVLRALEAQVINGSGLGENLRGILQTSGIGTVAYDVAETSADQALEGVVTVLLSDANPNVTAMHPRDWADLLHAKTTGSGEYLAGGPFVAAVQRLWNTALVPAKGIPQGTILVGDTAIGATLLVREGVNVTVSDHDQDDYVRNRVTVLAEGRWALAVDQPAAWCAVDLAA